MKKFKGFPPGKVRMTALPAAFFSELLPLVDDLAELKVTLFCLWAFQQKEGRFRYLRRRDFTDNTTLMQSLQTIADSPEAALDAGLERAVERGTLLRAEVRLNEDVEPLYFANTALGRVAIEQIKAGKWRPGDINNPVEILPERPNIYQMYEANIGPLTPLIVEELKDAEREYPQDWIEEAFQAALEHNVRKWAYIRAILERWQAEGKSREIAERYSEQDGRRYISGKYADFIEY